MDPTQQFEAERPRLVRIAARVLADPVEAEDVVQQAWLRLHAQHRSPDSVPAWLTTVTTRLCLDRLRARTPRPTDDLDTGTVPDVADGVVLADAVGSALQVVLDRLSPPERVAFVLHDSFAFDFAAIAELLDTTTAAARKLASRARAKVQASAEQPRPVDRQVVDAFLAAARNGEFARLLSLLAPDAAVSADAAAVAAGTPSSITGRRDVAGFFDGAARAALPADLDGRPVAAWFQRGSARVVFDFTIADGVVSHIRFRADPDVLQRVARSRSADADRHQGE